MHTVNTPYSHTSLFYTKEVNNNLGEKRGVAKSEKEQNKAIGV